MTSTKFIAVRDGFMWAVMEIERSTGQSLGLVMQDIETQGSAECWAEQLQDEEDSFNEPASSQNIVTNWN